METGTRAVVAAQRQQGSAGEVFLAALRLGLTSFGGPIAHIGYFRNEYVLRRCWLDDHAYSELLGLCQFLPGPASSQLGFSIGWMRAGAVGALAAWLGFTLPSALLLFAFAMASRNFHGWVADALVHGLKIAALAVVAQAIIGMARNLTPDLRRVIIAAIATVLMLLLANPSLQLLLIAAGAIAGILVCRPRPTMPQHSVGRAPARATGIAAFVLFGLLLVGLPFLAQANGWAALANAFYRSGALVFGGGHVVLPLLRQGLVPGWMNDRTFLAGYGAAQAMPGPLFSIGSYLGAVALPRAPIAGSAVGLVAIFLPGMLLVIGSLAFRHRIVASALASRAIAGVNAVVVGLLAAAFYNPLWTTSIGTFIDLLIAASTLTLLLRFKVPPIIGVLFCVVASLAAAL